MKLVKFENSKYGVRKGNWFIGYTFIDLKSPRFTWVSGDRFFEDCQGGYEDAKKILQPLKYEVIN